MATTNISEIPPLSEEMKARWHALLEEYHDLTDLDLNKTITPEQQKRLAKVTAELNEIDACLPQNIYMRQKEEEIQREMEALLAYVESLPDK